LARATPLSTPLPYTTLFRSLDPRERDLPRSRARRGADVIDRARLREGLDRERRLFEAEHPRARAFFERARRALVAGVPMPWMVRSEEHTSELQSLTNLVCRL